MAECTTSCGFYELSQRVRRQGDGDAYSLLLLLLRSGLKDFNALQVHCKHAPCTLEKLKGVGPITATGICNLCRKYTGVKEGECSNDRALAPEDTLLGLQQRGKLNARTYKILCPKCTTLNHVRKHCGGDPAGFSALCEGLSAKGMQEICSLCEQHLQDTCDFILSRGDLEVDKISDVYINNVIRAFGVSQEEALWALRYGTSYK